MARAIPETPRALIRWAKRKVGARARARAKIASGDDEGGGGDGGGGELGQRNKTPWRGTALHDREEL